MTITLATSDLSWLANYHADPHLSGPAQLRLGEDDGHQVREAPFVLAISPAIAVLHRGELSGRLIELKPPAELVGWAKRAFFGPMRGFQVMSFAGFRRWCDELGEPKRVLCPHCEGLAWEPGSEPDADGGRPCCGVCDALRFVPDRVPGIYAVGPVNVDRYAFRGLAKHLHAQAVGLFYGPSPDGLHNDAWLIDMGAGERGRPHIPAWRVWLASVQKRETATNELS